MSKARDTLDALSLTNAPDDGKQYVRKYDNWEEAPVTGYALLDFGTVTINNRYVQDNPFGNDTPALCLLEIFHNNKWSDPEWIWSAGGWGTAVQFVSGEGIVVVTGNRYIAYNSQESGGAHTGTFSLTSAPCRVHVWRLEG
ncbi:hypothetical protein [Endozoicomonas sp. ALB091]|uniref:hypothetical protein n=1 Tax=Endozoicomonas sp. ALB091 TaxID=3403073 RepID=UPI003BB7851F